MWRAISGAAAARWMPRSRVRAKSCPGVAASFVTTCAVFGPLAFISGDIGRVLKVLPVVLILVLAVSLVEAFLILPHHLVHSLGGGARASSRFRAAFDRGVERLRNGVAGRLVDGAVRWRYPFLGAVVALFLFSVAMLASGRIGFQAFPDIEGDVIEAWLLLRRARRCAARSRS